MNISYTLLGILVESPSYGYTLKHRYDVLFGKDKPLAFGQVYSTLSRLIRDKKIAELETVQNSGPERKMYHITKEGLNDLFAWVAEPEAMRSDAAVFAKTITAILAGSSSQAYLDTQKHAYMERMRQLTKLRKTGSLREALQADYELFHIEADLRWIEITQQRIEELIKEVKHD